MATATAFTSSLDARVFDILGDMRQQSVALQALQEKNTSNEAVIQYLTRQLAKKDRKIRKLQKQLCSSTPSTPVPSTLVERPRFSPKTWGSVAMPTPNIVVPGNTPDQVEVGEKDDYVSDAEDYMSVHSSIHDNEDQVQVQVQVQTQVQDIASVQSDVVSGVTSIQAQEWAALERKGEDEVSHVTGEDEVSHVTEDRSVLTEELDSVQEENSVEGSIQVDLAEEESIKVEPVQVAEEEKTAQEEEEDEGDELVIVFHKGKNYCHDTATGEVFDLVPNPDDPENPEEICGSEVVGTWVDGKIVLKSDKAKKVKPAKC